MNVKREGGSRQRAGALGLPTVVDDGFDARRGAVSTWRPSQTSAGFPVQQHVDGHGITRRDETFPYPDNVGLFNKSTMLSDAQLFQLDTALGPYSNWSDHSQWATVPVFDHNEYSYFPNGLSPSYGPLNLEHQHHALHSSVVVPHGLPTACCYSGVSCSLCQSYCGNLSSIDPREIFPGPSPVSALSSFSTAASSFDGMTDQIYEISEPTSSPHWICNTESSSDTSYYHTNAMRVDQACGTMQNPWTLVGDSGSQANRSRTGLSTYTMTPATSTSATTTIPQGVLYSLPTGSMVMPGSHVPYQNASSVQLLPEQQALAWDMVAALEPSAQHRPTQVESTACTSTGPYVLNLANRSTPGYGPVPAHPSALQAYCPQSSTGTVQQAYGPLNHSISLQQRHHAPVPQRSPPLQRVPRTPDPTTIPCMFTAIINSVPIQPPRPYHSSTLTPTMVVRKPNSTIATTTTASSKAKDIFLVQSKREGLSYKEIKELGNFQEAESTLRGRFRSLTKAKGARVRKPFWTKNDLRLLEDAVTMLTPSGGEATMVNGRGRSRVPWKKVAEYIVRRGGSYHFGNATCRKKWDELHRV